MKRVSWIVVVVLALVASGCQAFTDRMTTPAPEPPVETKDGHLTTHGGVATDLARGPDQQSLYATYVQLQDVARRLETEVSSLKAELAGVRASRDRAEEELDKERRLRTGAEADGERHIRLLREREAKVLALTTERVRSQQEILRLKIAALQQQIDAIDAAEAAAEPIR
jgi:chromosome segregation ATPase